MRHFIDLNDWASDEIRDLLDLARFLKHELRSGGNQPVLRHKSLAMIFQKPSLRTRVSFEVGMQQLGGHALMIAPDEIGLGVRETVPDIARVLSGYCHGIMARVFKHEHVLSLAEWASVPVINGLSDEQHPCQALADVLTIQEHFGTLNGLNVAYIGDGNNVAVSLAQALAHSHVNITVATPPQYDLPEDSLDHIMPLAERNGVTVTQLRDPYEAVRHADVIYTDAWWSMGQESQKDQRAKEFAAYQVDEKLVKSASKKTMVMHCLPAHRGYEISDAVMDGDQSLVFKQAENRLHAQKAILVRLMAG
jgi:ornithine carbamoyltransferase